MKKVLKVIKEIKDNYSMLNNSKSNYFRNDILKHISILEKDLKEYCRYKNIDYKKLMEDNNL